MRNKQKRQEYSRWLSKFQPVKEQYEYYGQGFREIGAVMIATPILELVLRQETEISVASFVIVFGLILWYIGSKLIIRQ